MKGLVDFAFSIPDFQRIVKGNHRHKLGDIILLMIFARMSGCVGRADIIEFGKHTLKKFQSMEILGNSVPSESTLCRVENGIDPMRLPAKLAELSKVYHDEFAKTCRNLEIICIESKATCGAVQKNGRNPDIISAYSPSTDITFATEACEEKSTEIKAIPCKH